MSEQLWYTWSDTGFGTAIGYRVRAASANLTDVEGQRVRPLVSLLAYTLSQDVNPFLPPQEAPRCLAFLKAGSRQESVLIQKVYIGLDGVGRPGAFFSHLITDLPPVPSLCQGGQVPFSPREAINLWRATTLWRDMEQGFPAGKRDLAPIPPTDLYSDTYAGPGPLTEQNVIRTPELFNVVLQAFLTLALSGERKRLYLGGSPDTVAALIWGITHALPRTLSIMLNLTFSTFEADVETDAKPLIVGTCWLPQHLKQGRENVLLDFPQLYYQANNPYGIAINCDDPQKQTPFTPPHSLIAKYAQFVLNCFQQGPMGMIRLTRMLDQAEKRNISEVMGFLNHYVDSQEMLGKADIIRILQALHDKVALLMTHAENALQQDKLATATAEAAQMESIVADAEMLAQDNVQQSILTLIMQDRGWWETEGQTLIGKLYRLSNRYTQEQLRQLVNVFFRQIVGSKAWGKNQGADLISAVRPFVQDYAQDAPPQERLSAFALKIESRVLEAEKALRKALLALANSIADQLVQVMQADQLDTTVKWSHIFKANTDPSPDSLEIWTHLLQQFASGSRYTNTYKELWTKYCKQELGKLRPLVSSTTGTTLASAFTTFSTYAGQQLINAIQTDNATTTPFWGDIVATCAPPARELSVWSFLLSLLGGLAYTPAYEQWWEVYGEKALNELMKELVALANKHPDNEPGRAFSAFIQQPFSSLQFAIKNNQLPALAFWKKMLSTIAPASNQPYLWVDLLQKVLDALMTQGFRQWWEVQGREVTKTLRTLASTSQANISTSLLAFAQPVAAQVSNAIIQEAQRGLQKPEANVTFLFEVQATAIPAQDNGIWLTQLQQLSHAYVYKQASWGMRSWLLQYWKNVPTLQQKEAQAALRPWFEVSWGELSEFLALDLPDAWCNIAITKALETYAYTSQQQVLDTVKLYPALFENVLQSLIRVYQTQSTAIRFFSFLAQHRYTSIIPLLDRLLSASGYQKDIAEQLLAAAQLTTNTDIVELLENHCQDMLANYELPPTMLRLIEHYLVNFDVEYLDTDPTRSLLLRLQQREKVPPLRLSPRIQQAVAGWYKIAESLAQPETGRNALRDLIASISDVKRLVEEQKTQAPAEVLKKLITKLTPRLVELATSEADLARVIDHLDQGNELFLFQEMTKVVGEKYRQEPLLMRVVPYTRMVLGEARHLDSSRKETFIDTCFQLLFKQIDERTRDKYLPELAWPRTYRDEWNAFLDRQRFIDGLNRFKEAVSKIYIPGIVGNFDPVFQPYLAAEELELVERAKIFVRAYSAGNDAAMVQAHEMLKHYYTHPLYTTEQVERYRQARQRIAQQQASARQLAVNQNLDSGQAAGNAQHSSFSPVASEPPSAFPPAGNAQASPFSQAGNGSSQSATPSPNGAQAGPAASQGNVAMVRGQAITAAWLEWVLPLKSPYTTERVNEIHQQMQRLKESDEKQHKQQSKLLKQELQALKKLQEDARQLREAALYDLIQDVFIQEEITDLVQTDATKRAVFDETHTAERVKQLHTRLRMLYQHNYPPLGSQDENTLKDVQKVLAVFVRREQFTTYLYTSRQIGLDEWWKEHLRREGANINIDYKQANITPPRGGLWSRIGLV